MHRFTIKYYQINKLLCMHEAGQGTLIIEYIDDIADAKKSSMTDIFMDDEASSSLVTESKLDGLINKNAKLNQWFNCFANALKINVIDAVVAYKSAMLVFDTNKTDMYRVLKVAKSIEITKHNNNLSSAKTHRIPVCYGLQDNTRPTDIHRVSQVNGVSIDTLISLHCEQKYHVFAVGFMPNFAYMGEINEALETPRLAEPRVSVPSGAVAIADKQTAIYPSVSPGGWNIIGYTPLDLTLNTNKDHQMRFKTGDKVVFEAIDLARFTSLSTT